LNFLNVLFIIISLLVLPSEIKNKSYQLLGFSFCMFPLRVAVLVWTVNTGLKYQQRQGVLLKY
jgi:hypothetical protein